MVTEFEALERLRAWLAATAFVLGVCAGLLSGWYDPGELNMILEAMVGGLATPLVGALGGLAGLAMRVAFQSAMRNGQAPPEPLDAPAALLLGTVCGSFAGMLFALLFLEPGLSRHGALIGSFLGGAAMAAAGDMADVILRMAIFTGRTPPDDDGDDSPLDELEDFQPPRKKKP